MALVNSARPLTQEAGLRDSTSASVGQYLKYVELGAVSPDYPYLALKAGQTGWADRMHYTKTATLLRAGVVEVRALKDAERERALAWLLGMAAHMTTDMTIHPVVEKRVGPYAQNKDAHRRCEMHQDAFIFPRIMNVGETVVSNHLKSGIATCGSTKDPSLLDEAIAGIWTRMLQTTYPTEFAASPPEPSTWHGGFQRVLGALGAAGRLFPFARHVAADANLNYPITAGIDQSYILNLQTPESAMDYADIFARARKNVLGVWKGMDEAVEHGDSKLLASLEDWDLDTGRSVGTRKYVFWGAVQ
jgi:hypothetical protein